MAIIPVITSAVKKFSGKPLGIMSKALGVATVASVVYDSHVNGREKAIVTDNTESADRFFKQYKNYMVSPKESATVCGLKKHWFDFQQSFSLFHPYSKTKGYVGGFGKTIVDEIPNIALGAVALATKGIPSKVAGVLLAVNAVKTCVFDVFGVGSMASSKNIK
ncbi:MAG: hypothetical protein E7Z90_00245 [Cyanobacteria bacterium SIG29]|nr:hypothetical protein [Cyanobacteria bacterium SIG29]